MDKLTDLLKEAKPLYKQRQKRKTIAKFTLMLATPAILMSSICQLYIQGNDIYVALHDNSLQNELIEDEFGF